VADSVTATFDRFDLAVPLDAHVSATTDLSAAAGPGADAADAVTVPYQTIDGK
jgi:hypothetical protein